MAAAGLVAPLAGARIEIETVVGGGTGNMSLPSRERGLKFPWALLGFFGIRRSPRGSAD